MNKQNLVVEIEALESKISLIVSEIKDKQADQSDIEIEVSEDQYDDWLDDLYGDVSICGMSYSASYALKECDPIAYRCGKSDYESSLDVEDSEEYQDLQNEIEELESQLEDLQSEIEDFQNELEDLQSEIEGE